MMRTKRARAVNKQGQDKNAKRTSLEHLPPHLIFSHIFPLLPVFTLLPFKLVCKAWHNLFHQYRLKTGPIPREPNLLTLGKDLLEVYLYDFNLGPTKIESPAKDMRDRVDRVLSCNGLLCILPSPKHLRFQVCIYNPLTRVHRFLPYQERWKTIYHHFGFGFHRGTNEYKVVRITETALLGKNQVINSVDVITLTKAGSWRSITQKPAVFFEGSSDVVADDSIHWLCIERYPGGHSCGIVSFNLAEERFSRIKTPFWPEGCVLAVLGGCLALTDPEISTDGLNIWTMDGATKLWTKKFDIDIKPNLLLSMEFIRPVCLLNNGDIVVLNGDRVPYVYHRNQRCFEPIETCSLELHQYKVVRYDPVLFSP